MSTIRKIKSTRVIRDEIIRSLGCSVEMIRRSLDYTKDTALARAIRKEAIQLGAQELVIADAEEVFVKEDGKLVQYGKGQMFVIDLRMGFVRIYQGEELLLEKDLPFLKELNELLNVNNVQ